MVLEQPGFDFAPELVKVVQGQEVNFCLQEEEEEGVVLGDHNSEQEAVEGEAGFDAEQEEVGFFANSLGEEEEAYCVEH